MGIFIIAEIGINHNGSLDIAKKLIQQAKECGCDAVKFQKRTIEKVYTKEFLDSHRESPWGQTQADQKKGLEFSKEDYLEINDYCKKINIEWFASCWDNDSQILMRSFDLKFNKIASPMIVDKNFLKLVADEKKHTFISTGMCNMKNIDDAVEIFKQQNCSFELMHCVSVYPLPPEKANLSMINTLKNKYKCNVGYSGHEVGLSLCIAAAALGITSIERHFTLDRSMYGSDQSASVEPQGIKNLVSSIRAIEASLGSGEKSFLDEEKINAKKLREHLKY